MSSAKAAAGAWGGAAARVVSWPAKCVLTLALVVSGCGTTRPNSPPEALQCGLEKRGLVVRDALSPVLKVRKSMLAAARVGDAGSTFNILSLSAGGEFGAYGAAFLHGWASVGAAAVPVPRQDIHVVTGVSTGSMIATHAFLGEEATVEDAFRHLSGADVYRKRWPPAYLWANSLFDAAGKDRIIETFITSDIVDRVAAAGAERGLYIGVVDLDSGQFLRIDMVKLAQVITPKSLRDDCYRAVIGASSAIPIAFPPKFVDDRMLVDGGARRHLFFTDLSEVAKSPDVTRNLVSIVHGDLQVESGETTNGILQIAGRVSELFTDQGMKDSIFLQETMATSCIANVGLGCPVNGHPQGAVFRTFYAAAAVAAKQCASKKQDCISQTGVNSEDMFCNPFMKCLADQGQKDGVDYASGRGPWLKASDLNLSSSPPSLTSTSEPRPLIKRMPLQ